MSSPHYDVMRVSPSFSQNSIIYNIVVAECRCVFNVVMICHCCEDWLIMLLWAMSYCAMSNFVYTSSFLLLTFLGHKLHVLSTHSSCEFGVFREHYNVDSS